jgi:hypothetical protein
MAVAVRACKTQTGLVRKPLPQPPSGFGVPNPQRAERLKNTPVVPVIMFKIF